MSTRFSNALAIQLGACNPSGIAHSLIDACRECRDEGMGTDAIYADPAIRLMVHQLGYLHNIRALDDDMTAYSAATKACEAAIAATSVAKESVS
jgi:hypothetical protein